MGGGSRRARRGSCVRGSSQRTGASFTARPRAPLTAAAPLARLANTPAPPAAGPRRALRVWLEPRGRQCMVRRGGGAFAQAAPPPLRRATSPAGRPLLHPTPLNAPLHPSQTRCWCNVHAVFYTSMELPPVNNLKFSLMAGTGVISMRPSIPRWTCGRTLLTSKTCWCRWRRRRCAGVAGRSGAHTVCMKPPALLRMPHLEPPPLAPPPNPHAPRNPNPAPAPGAHGLERRAGQPAALHNGHRHVHRAHRRGKRGGAHCSGRARSLLGLRGRAPDPKPAPDPTRPTRPTRPIRPRQAPIS